jgi:hypothetical protein
VIFLLKFVFLAAVQLINDKNGNSLPKVKVLLNNELLLQDELKKKLIYNLLRTLKNFSELIL